MSFMRSMLSAAENGLPAWLESKNLQWLCLAYTLWQLVRTNRCVLWILCILPHCFRIKFLHKRYLVFLISFAATAIPFLDEVQCPFPDNDDAEEGYWNEHPPQTIQVVGRHHRGGWPPSWRAIKYRDYYYFTSKEALRRMAAWIHRCHGNEHNVIFGEITDLKWVCQDVCRHQAYLKILSGDYFVHAVEENMWYIPATWINYIELNRLWWGTLGTLPTVLQLWNLNRCATVLVFIIILLDFNRYHIHFLYQSLLIGFRRFVKSRILRQQETCYIWLTLLFGPSWSPPPGRDGAYTAAKGDKIEVYNFSNVSNLEDVEIYGGGEIVSHQHDADKNSIVRLWEGKGFSLGRQLQTFTYANATLGTDVFIE